MARFASDDELDAYRRLRAQIASHARRNRMISEYAEAERLQRALDVRLPDGKEIQQTPLHWPQKAIEVFASRLVPAGFSVRQGEALLQDLEDAWADSNIGYAEMLAIEASLRHGPAFLFQSRGDTGEPEVVVTAASATQATCTLDRRSWRVTEALELLDDRRANLHLPGRVLTVTARAAGRLVVDDEVEMPPGRVFCAPYIHGATLDRPFGTSRISRPVRGFTDAAVRTFQRQEVSGAHYAQPRERLLGVSPESFKDDTWGTDPGELDALPDVHPDDDPNMPDELRRAQVLFRPQMSMVPFSDAFRLIAAQFSGASSIPLQYLGIVQDSNPTSAPAIEAQDIDLVRAVKAQYPSYNLGRRLLAINVLTLLETDVSQAALRSLQSRWIDPRVRSVREQSDFVKAQVEAGNFQKGTRATLDLLPISPEDAAAHAAANQRAGGAANLLEALRAGAGTPLAPNGTGTTAAEMKAKFDALGVAIRAGVEPTVAAAQLGLEGLTFTGAIPSSLRLPVDDAAQVEDA